MDGLIAAAAALLTLPAAVLAAPAEAADTPARPGPSSAAVLCTVNGVFRTGPVVVGTERADEIRCSTVGPGGRVDGRGGDDDITVEVLGHGVVDGGPGSDTCRAGTEEGGLAVRCEDVGAVVPLPHAH